MKPFTACIAAVAIGLTAATPATAMPLRGADLPPRAIPRLFPTPAQITQTLRLAQQRLPAARRQSVRAQIDELSRLRRWYDSYNRYKRAKRYCELAQDIFGYPRRYYYDGYYVYSYPYDACEEYFL